MADDEYWLRRAIALAHHCPASDTAFSVGALIVDAGTLVAEGHSRQESPADHAEEVALRHLQSVNASMTLYSSLEPCGQRASRPEPCANLIVAAGIGRVVYAWSEPDTFVAPMGARILRRAGVEVVALTDLAPLAAEPNAHLLDQPERRNP